MRANYAIVGVLLVVPVFATQPTGCARSPDATADPRWNLTVAEARRLVEEVRAGRDLTPSSWRGGKRVAVALTFDVDGELLWMRLPQQASPGSLSRGTYGVRAGLDRILALLDRRNVPATFFLPAVIMELHPEVLPKIRVGGRHEIGYHSWAHENILTLSPRQELEAMQRALGVFEQHGLEPRGHRSASWVFRPSTLALIEEFGFLYDSSLMADDRPYELMRNGRATGIVELPVDWCLDDWPYFQLEWSTPMPGLRTPSDVLAIWKAEFEGARRSGGTFVLTMHPQVIGRWSRLRMLDALLDHIDSTNDAWYATLGDIAAYVRAGSTATALPSEP